MHPVTALIIRELQNGKAVKVPELGIFESHVLPAHIDPVSSTIHPASAALSFTEQAVTDKTTFLKHLSQAQKLSLEEAELLVRTYVQAIKDAVLENGKCEMEGFGTFSQNPEKELVFNLNNDILLYPDAFGLPVIERKALLKNDSSKIARLIIQEQQRKKLHTKEEGKKASRFPLILLLILLFAGLVFSAWYFNVFEIRDTLSGKKAEEVEIIQSAGQKQLEKPESVMIIEPGSKTERDTTVLEEIDLMF